ncbi:MAG: hypothetical protein KJ052_13965 [Candidatus Hydrogenedentes bacterium]|nr:hypothetical protein [Candidatus Hydrogenedentota bacterium]
MKPVSTLLMLTILLIAPQTAMAELRAKAQGQEGNWRAAIYDDDTPVFTGEGGTSSLALIHAGVLGASRLPVTFAASTDKAGDLTLSGATVEGLEIQDAYRSLASNLIERTVTVTALTDARYFLDFGWRVAVEGSFHSFTGEETQSISYSPGCTGPEFGGGSLQTFPFLGCRAGGTVYGIIGDTPGLWENRSFMAFDLEGRAFSLANGDGSARRIISIPRELDATSVYRMAFDGWQHIEAGQTQTWTTWIISSPVQTQYDIQLAAHLGLANAKGFNQSGLEAILRNTSYMLLRRNLLRPESDYIFISGVGYGWKQWVTDGFYMSRGLDIPEYDVAAQAAVFFERINYEDNAQYYLIWAVLAKRAGGDLDMRTVDRAYHFIRQNEKDGLFMPPRLKPDIKYMRTYHDMLPYEDNDPPSSNQGFHCGALLAARELGYDVTDEDIERAKAGYRSMFNAEGGYMATSLMQQEHIGQDSLYGEVLTYAVFGEKLLPDEIVKTHLETTARLQTPYGMRVISKANGDLLDGHTGVYVFGGSWFLNDACVWMDGLIHGVPAEEIDAKLLWRLERELAVMPAFHESISTLDGHPHGHHLYSWNSGFWWLRQRVRERLGMTGPDPLTAALDAKLGIVRRDGMLYLKPETATLRPQDAEDAGRQGSAAD